MCPVTAVICRSFACAGNPRAHEACFPVDLMGSAGSWYRVQTDSWERQSNPAFVAVIKENSTKLIFQLHSFMCSFLKTVVKAFLNEYSAEHTCVFSFQKYFLFWISACPSSPMCS